MQERRKQIIIKSGMQQHLAIHTILFVFISVNVIATVGMVILHSTDDMIDIRFYLPFIIATLEIVGIVIVYRLSLKDSLRIAGPVYVFEKALNEVRQGNLTTEVHLRKGDYLHDVKDELNETLQILNTKISTLQRLANEAGKISQGNEPLDKLTQELTFFTCEKKESPSND